MSNFCFIDEKYGHKTDCIIVPFPFSDRNCVGFN